jgi:hypothetical protein
MTPTDNPLDFFRTMKGAPHSVLAVLAYNGRPMTNHELQLWTGYHGDTISRVTRDLIEMGWLEARTPIGPWSLARGRSMPGMVGLAPTTLARPEFGGGHAERPRENPAQASANSARPRGNSASSSGFSASPSSAGWLDGNPEEEEEDPSHPPEPELGHADFRETLKVLEEAGVDEPAASRIAHLQHVSADYVRAHLERARAEGRSLGAAIFRMQRGWRVPGKKSGDVRRELARQKMRKFMEGQGL